MDEIQDYLGVDSLKYLSIEGLLKSVPEEDCGYCTACFNGSYSVPVAEECGKTQYEKPFQEVE